MMPSARDKTYENDNEKEETQNIAAENVHLCPYVSIRLALTVTMAGRNGSGRGDGGVYL